MTGVAACDSHETSHVASLLMACGVTEVTVKLPAGTRLKRVTALGKTGVIGSVSTLGSEEEFVRITTEDTVNISKVKFSYFRSKCLKCSELIKCFLGFHL